MLQKRFDFLVATVFLGLLPIDAHAYLDPGTGSMLLSVVMGLVSTGYFVIRRLPSMMRALFFRMTGKRDDLKNNSIVFYSESRSYWLTFKPVLEALHQRGVKCTYLTSDENDPVFNAGLDDTVRSKYIGKGNTAYTALSFLEADVFALTTPGIDVLQIRRSPGVKNTFTSCMQWVTSTPISSTVLTITMRCFVRDRDRQKACADSKNFAERLAKIYRFSDVHIWMSMLHERSRSVCRNPVRYWLRRLGDATVC